ncbi:MAG TPA: nucleotide disphospho-sugar-binding domain-containing protein, partial [Puia sp.]|nr:nucleotide disphospho-sugar-binding domain-containing protein [Puia sp.]
MSRILLFSGGRSFDNASMTLARALIEKGHHVLYFDTTEERAYLEQQGFEVHSIKAGDLAENETGPKTAPAASRRHSVIRQKMRYLDRLYSFGERWIEQNSIDLLLLDANALPFAVPFLKKKIPIINLTCTLSSVHRHNGPPVFSHLLPAKKYSLLRRIAYQTAWLRIFFPQYLRDGVEALKLRMAFGTQPAEDVPARIKKYGGKVRRTEYGLRLLAPEIVMGPGCIDFPDARTPGKLYANACICEDRKEESFDAGCLDKQKPLIYCAIGTCSNAYLYKERFQQTVINAMGMLPDYQLVIQGIEKEKFNYPGPIPGNVRIFKTVPQLELLQRARIFITHGGFSSIRESLFYGVPMIVFPGWHDQSGNAARVVYHGLG